MSRTTSFVLGIVVGAVGLYVTENYYVVRSAESFHLIPKVSSKLEMPYRDIRNYTVEDWHEDPSLAVSLMRTKNDKLVLDTGLDAVETQLEDFVRSLGNSG